MTDAEIIKAYAPACAKDMEETGVLASVSLALILLGKADSPQGTYLKTANTGRKNRGALLYPGIGKCKTFEEAAEIMKDDGAMLAVNKRWALSKRFDKPAFEETPVKYKVTSTTVRIYSGPGKDYARMDHCCKKGPIEISKEKNGFGRLTESAGWIELKKCKKQS